ncbi:hypothetical protein [Leucobacter aridicollis]|uniref:hypothetical protein n=1 Tax=Leucobacter aridicollis TaxID=283878 RepID=UPI002106DD50|nr:hypothetical protein [Leucobacter aridicollis]UTX52076.1 hypothetical protein KI794_09875 [Leucobacter aridicollis]
MITQLALLGALILGVILAGDLDEIFSSALNTGLILGTLALAIVAAIWEIVGATRGRPHKYKGRRRDEKILKYMTRLLSSEEQCVMSSNDLSWVKGKARTALFTKAKKESLTLLMPKPTQLSQELEKQGATAFYYGDDDYKFRSRFTLVNPDRSDARVAIGYGTSDAHVIRVIQTKDDPAIHLVEDLFSLLKRSSRSEAAK